LFKAFIMKRCWILSKAFSVAIEMIMWFLSLLPFMCCITLIVCVEPSLHPWNETYLIMVYHHLNVLFEIGFASILFSIFAFMFIKEIGL
jgi:hypothetical protein